MCSPRRNDFSLIMCACYSSQDFPMSACVRALCGCPRLIVTKIVEPNCGAVCVALRRSLGGEACHRAPFVVIRCVSSPIAVHGTPHTHCNMYGTLCLFFCVIYVHTVRCSPHTRAALLCFLLARAVSSHLFRFFAQSQRQQAAQAGSAVALSGRQVGVRARAFGCHCV